MHDNETYLFWRSHPYFDDATRQQLDMIKHDAAEIEDRFGKELAFGTGGIRGIVGAGTNRMNIYVVRRVSQALAALIAQRDAQQQGVVVGYDSRCTSAAFAAEAAQVFAGNGIRACLFGEPRPTPMLSFAVRQLHAAAGVMITASHNPKEYNGYKVYGEDGAQLSDTREMADAVAAVRDITCVRPADTGAAIKAGLIRGIGKDFDEAYLSALSTLFDGCDAAPATPVRIVYTPLHGTGGEMVLRALKQAGFSDINTVEGQYRPDGDFPTLHTTLNPEDREVYDRALMLAKQKDADLVIATDPDCDRVGVMVRKAIKRYALLTGNEAGALMLSYLLHTKRPDELHNGFVAKTIVTTRLADMLAQDHGVSVEDVLTGFKYIGALIRKLHDAGQKQFIFGMEDSCGYLLGTDVRDKDGVIGCVLIARAAAWYRSQGLSLYQALCRLQKKYGWFAGELVSRHMDEDRLRSLRESLFADMSGAAFKDLGLIAVRNYAAQSRRDLGTGKLTGLSLPKSDAVYYELADGWFCIRPSGTESKLKIYFEVRAKNKKAAIRQLNRLKRSVLKKTGVTG